MSPSAVEELDLQEILRPGDQIVVGQACGEPSTLIEALFQQHHLLDGVSIFVATSFSGVFSPSMPTSLAMSSMGAIGELRSLAAAHRLQIVPCHVSQIGPLIESGAIRCDVAFVQVSPSDADGRHSFGLVSDHVAATTRTARTVVAEVNDQVPFTFGQYLHADVIDHAVRSSRQPVQVISNQISDTERAIATHAASFVQDRSVLQIGVGAVPDAILRMVSDRRDLGVHSGMIGDGVVDLIESGVITNAYKEIDTGVTVTGALIGTDRLYTYAHRNRSVRMCSSDYTHGAAPLGALTRLVTVNSALQVDLTGQVNAEQTGTLYVGGNGGQGDYARSGSRSQSGRGLIVLPSTAKRGTVSRITTQLTGPVTTPRSDADVIITEYGAACLRGRTLAERARLLAAIAHPAFREDLERHAAQIASRGY
ncbi:acetyl-CoA hydrolase/transferase family protein [Gordonia sp. NPDC127522]|uniref:acetyl-CoA hydrolase/transferase family protein n=1 Tax=Gordonia sp. NPDC127522 TaxID=3345390 RepID=UPI00363F5363